MSKFFPKKVNFEKEGKKENGRVAPCDSIPIDLINIKDDNWIMFSQDLLKEHYNLIN